MELRVSFVELRATIYYYTKDHEEITKFHEEIKNRERATNINTGKPACQKSTSERCHAFCLFNGNHFQFDPHFIIDEIILELRRDRL